MHLKSTSFTNKLEEATIHSHQDQTLTDAKQFFNKSASITKYYTKVNHIHFPHQLYHLQQIGNYFIYFFTNITQKQYNRNEQGQPQFSLCIFIYNKVDKYCRKTIYRGLQGTPTCITSGFKTTLKPVSQLKQSNQVQNLYGYNLTVLVGLNQGFVKIIDLAFEKVDKQMKMTITSHKLEQKSISSIRIAEKTLYNQKNICFVMFEDCKVFIFNFLSLQIIGIYQPPTLSFDWAVAFSLHCSGKYFATAGRSGQIIFWELSEKALIGIEKSQDKKTKKYRDTDYFNQMVQVDVWTFGIRDRVVSAVPMTSVHSASLAGLKWIGFMGNLMALVTTGGMFRLISLNFDSKDEFICLIDYPIANGQSVSSVQLYPESETLIVFKSLQYKGEFQFIVEEDTQPTSVQIDSQTNQIKEKVPKEKKRLKHRFDSSNFKTYESDKMQNCMEILSVSKQLTVHSVKKYWFVENFPPNFPFTREQIQVQRAWRKNSEIPLMCSIYQNTHTDLKHLQFYNGALTKDRKFVMVRTNMGFYIGEIPKIQPTQIQY